MSDSAVALVKSFLDAVERCSTLVATEIGRECGIEGLRAALEGFEEQAGVEWYEELTNHVFSRAHGMDARLQEVCSATTLERFVGHGDTSLADNENPRSSSVAGTTVALTEIGLLLAQMYAEDQPALILELLNDANSVPGVKATEVCQRQLGDWYDHDRGRLGGIGINQRNFLRRQSRRSNHARIEIANRMSAAMNRSEEAVAAGFQSHLIHQALEVFRHQANGAPPRTEYLFDPKAKRIFRLGDSTICVFVGSITDSHAHIVVSSDDNLLTMGGGVSRAIQLAAGLEIIRDATKMTPLSLGDVVVTTAGQMPNRYVAHAVTMRASGGSLDLPRGLMVRQLCHKIMALLPQLNCRSVAFPAIGAGVAGIPYEEVATEMGEALLDAVLLADDPVDVELYLLDRFGGDGVDTFLAIFEATALGRFGLTAQVADENSNVVNLTPFVGEGSARAREADARIAQVVETLRDLDSQRSRIEAEILEITNSPHAASDQELWAMRARLDVLAELRNIYQTELRGIPSTSIADKNSVFVSSTSKDLQEHRSAVRGVVDRLKLKFVGMEDFEANALAPADLIRKKVLESNIYLGILGMRYGFVDEASGLSMTELEYRQAVAGEKDIRMFVMDEDAPVKASMVERAPDQLKLLNDFRDRVLTSHACNLFKTPHDLALKVERTLSTIDS